MKHPRPQTSPVPAPPPAAPPDNGQSVPAENDGHFPPSRPRRFDPFPEYGGMSLSEIAQSVHREGKDIDWREVRARFAAARSGANRERRPVGLMPAPTETETAEQVARRRAARYAEEERRNTLAPGENIGDREINAAIQKLRRAGKRIKWGELPLLSVHIIRMNRGMHPTEDRILTGEEWREWEGGDVDH